MKRDIIFLMPARGLKPAGGFKVVFTYADYFSRKGHGVHIIYPYVDYDFFTEETSFFSRAKIILGYAFRILTKKLRLQDWFKFETPVEQRCVFRLNKSMFSPYSDIKNSIVFATAVDTAYALDEIKAVPDEQKFYFIQGFENWDFDDSYVYESYKFPFKKIVISNWLKKEVEKTGGDAVVIQNGLDFDYFKLRNSIENRNPFEIAMLYHESDVKRCCDAFAALDIVRRQIPELHVSMFGAYECPANLPEWYTYYKKPDMDVHNAIYNGAAVFVASSSTEGWGLTPCEAMQCGAAVACTDAGGYLEFAKNEETALVSKVYDVNSLADNILRLVEDSTLRIRLAKAGNDFVKRFTWERAFSKMSEAIEDC